MGPVKLRHASAHITYGHSGPNMDPSNIPDDLMSLEDFLAESEKTPNRVCEWSFVNRWMHGWAVTMDGWMVYLLLYENPVYSPSPM